MIPAEIGDPSPWIAGRPTKNEFFNSLSNSARRFGVKRQKTSEMENMTDLFSNEALSKLFPADRANRFFDALFGDAEEGAYDIKLVFTGQTGTCLNFALELHERPGRCLACNLTYGLPEVFSRHPVINIKGLVEEINTLLAGRATCTGWRLGATNSVTRKLHTIPLTVNLG
ncbi:pancreas/duodenum homeobox protein 1 [Thiovibrio sp. JS02]